jgi:hypothetical protein
MSLKRLLDTLFVAAQPPSGSVDDLTKKISDLTDENEKLKKLYLKTHVDISALQGIVKTIAYNQAQLAADMHTIYTSVRDAGIMDADYSEVESNNPSDPDDDDPPDGSCGMGGMLN